MFLSMEIYKNWLRSRNVKFSELPFGILFQYQGGAFIISDNAEDKLYLQVIMPNVYEASSYEKEKAMKVMNKMNREFKALKATMQDDGQVWLAVETFIDSTPDIEDFFDRILMILLQGRMKFQMLMS